MRKREKRRSSLERCPAIKLYMFPGSNSARTAELMLRYKRLPYEEVILTPCAHVFQLPARGFTGITVPAVKIDRRRVQRTRNISRVLDELRPEPRLFPADPARRRAVEEAERWGEELQNALRRIFYCATRRDRSAFPSVIAEGHPNFLLRRATRGFAWVAGTRHRATDTAGCADLAALPERLDQVDAWIGAGLLNGEELNAADFQIAPNIAGLLRFDDLAPFIEGRPAAAHAMRVAGEYRGHVGRVFPPDWLEPLRRSAGDRKSLSPSGAGNAPLTVAGGANDSSRGA